MSIEFTGVSALPAPQTGAWRRKHAQLSGWVRRTATVPLWVHVVGLLAWAVALVLVWRAGGLRSYGDALSHELIARRTLDSRNPGLAQLGTVWLPLPSFLLVPLVAIDPLWRLGIAGALVGAVYLQLTLGALYRLGRLIGGTTVAAIAVIAFIANPNTLYLFVTPLTESAALAFTCITGAALAAVLVGFKAKELRLGALLQASLGAAASLLCRYDGWLLAVFVGVTLLIGGGLWLRDRERIEAAAFFYAAIPIAAMLSWLFYNWAIFGDPLAFQHGSYSSAAIVRDLAARGIIPTVAGQPPEAGAPLRAAATYGQAVLENAGVVQSALALGGLILALVWARRRPAVLALVPLLTPFVFYIIALSQAQSVIVTRAADPTGLFNVRYGSTLAPCIALGIAALAIPVQRFHRQIAILLGVVTIGAGGLLFAASGGPATIEEGQLQQRAITATAGREAASWLAAQPDRGLILVDDALQPQAQTVATYSNRQLRHYITSANPVEWDAALREPPHDVAWIITLGASSRDRPNDRVGRALLSPSDTIAGYVPAFDDGEIVIFQRSDLAAPVPVQSTMNTLPSSPSPTPTLAILLLVIVLIGGIGRELLPPNTPVRRRWRTGLAIALVPAFLVVGLGLGTRLVVNALPVFKTEIALAAAVPTPPLSATPTPAPAVAIAPTGDVATPTASAPTSPTATAEPAPVAPVTAPSPTVPTAATATPTALPTRAAAGTRTPQEVARSIEGLRSGTLVGQIQYNNGTVATIQLRFATVAGQQEPTSFASTTTYQGTTGKRTDERIVIGNRAWTRAAGQAWLESPTQNPQQEITALLPPIGSLRTATRNANGIIVWYDSERDADLRLELDPSTGNPSRLTQTTRSTGTILVVQYQGWNTPETITPPAGG